MNNADSLTDLINDAALRAHKETENTPEPQYTEPFDWPLECTVGPGLEGAVACKSKIGYVNGSKGWLIYRGYDIFDLAANCCFEEVCYLLLEGKLPNSGQWEKFNKKLTNYRHLNKTLRLLMGFPIENMNAMAALRLGTNLMRQEFTFVDKEAKKPALESAISTDEDSIPMETTPQGFSQAVYEFEMLARMRNQLQKEAEEIKKKEAESTGIEACCHLIAGVSTITAAISRLRRGLMPIGPDPELGHAANLLYMMTGKKPSKMEERVMDIALILHADHGMNASTFASMVVASTLSDVYFSVGSGIAALNGPLHGGANEKVIYTLKEIEKVENVKSWVDEQRKQKKKIAGFGHRVYKAYDPRARILGPIAEELVKGSEEAGNLFKIAQELEKEVVSRFGREKKIFPNVDFYSGTVYSCLGISSSLFVSLFAVSRVAGWTARVLEYLERNRIFRPRAIYTGEFNNKVRPLAERE